MSAVCNGEEETPNSPVIGGLVFVSRESVAGWIIMLMFGDVKIFVVFSTVGGGFLVAAVLVVVVLILEEVVFVVWGNIVVGGIVCKVDVVVLVNEAVLSTSFLVVLDLVTARCGIVGNKEIEFGVES